MHHLGLQPEYLRSIDADRYAQHLAQLHFLIEKLNPK
jgi:hypothetical protein